MKFGVALPNLGGIASTDTMVRMGQRVEELGFDSIFVSDHVVLPVKIESRYPYSSRGVFPVQAEEDILEPFTVLAFLAGMTKRVRLGISVLILPYRHPVLNAKMLTTLDVLSGGRIIAGVGVGWMKEEFEVLDADFEHRGSVTDEHVIIFKVLCTEDDPFFEGQHYDVKGIKFFPKPVQKPHPPIWVGGITHRALRRAAILGDGWHGVRATPQDVARYRDEMLQIRREHGLDTKNFQVSVRTTLEVTDTPLGERRIPFTGTRSQILEDLRQYEEAGTDYIVVGPRGRTFEQVMDNVERFAEFSMIK